MPWTYEEPSEIEDVDELITLDQAARIVHRSPLTLAARAVTRRPDGELWLQTLLLGGERYTTTRWVRAYLATALPPARPLDLDTLIARQADDPAFWSYVLARWLGEDGLDGAAACRRLGMPGSLGIMLLAGLSCPSPGSLHWEALVAFCGRYCQADVASLRALLLRFKRPAGPTQPGVMEEERVALRDGDGAFMARPLVHWQLLHAADDRVLGAYLGLPPRRLGLLAYYWRPDPRSAGFPDEVRSLARLSGCDVGRLAALLVAVAETSAA